MDESIAWERLGAWSRRIEAVMESPEQAGMSAGSTPPNSSARDGATEVVEEALHMGLSPVDITYTAAPGIAVWFERGSRYVVVECDNGGDAALLTSDGAGSRDCWLVGHNVSTLTELLEQAERKLVSSREPEPE